MSQATTTLGRSSPIVAEALRRRAILSCMIGNFLEIYDFTVYGFFASLSAKHSFHPAIR